MTLPGRPLKSTRSLIPRPVAFASPPRSEDLLLRQIPTDEESLALEAIRRMGSTIDTGVALEFLRGSQFFEPVNTSTEKSDRALPQSAVSILKLWFLVHQSDPYPTKEQKESLLKETGLSMIQLKNWFSNIRKRHWHPIRTGTRRPRSHVEYVLLYGAANTNPTPIEDIENGERCAKRLRFDEEV